MGVRWSVAYPLSTHHVEELTQACEVSIDHSTINRYRKGLLRAVRHDPRSASAPRGDHGQWPQIRRLYASGGAVGTPYTRDADRAASEATRRLLAHSAQAVKHLTQAMGALRSVFRHEGQVQGYQGHASSLTSLG
jgi:hypothetical protein